MMKMPYSKIKYLKKKFFLSNEYFWKQYNEIQKINDKVYSVKNKKIVFVEEKKYEEKNIFLIYTEEIYEIYKKISNLIDEVCSFYEISKNNFMIYGKIKEYGPNMNSLWYDYPGINLPFMHGIYNTSENDILINFKNNNQHQSEVLHTTEILINKPTDLLNFQVNETVKILEFYISPLKFLKNNEPGVWIPV